MSNKRRTITESSALQVNSNFPGFLLEHALLFELGKLLVSVA